MLAKVLVLFCGFILVTCERHKQSRFFSFNFEDRDITELPTININPASLVLGSAVVLGTTVVLPFIMKHYASNVGPDYRISRLLDNTEFSADTVINFANKMLSDGNSLRGCTLKVACWTAQKRDETMIRAVNRIASNKLLSAFINSTAVEDAMLSGQRGRDCSSFTRCPVPEQYMPMLLHNLSVLSKSYGLHD